MLVVQKILLSLNSQYNFTERGAEHDDVQPSPQIDNGTQFNPNPSWSGLKMSTQNSTTNAIQSSALPLEGVDGVHGSHGLPASVLGIIDSVTDHVLKEDLQDSAGLLVDEAADALHASEAGKPW